MEWSENSFAFLREANQLGRLRRLRHGGGGHHLAQCTAVSRGERRVLLPGQGEDGVMYIDIAYTERETNDRRNLVFPFYVIPDSQER